MSDQFKCFGLGEIKILATHYKIDEEVLKKEWCYFCFKLKDLGLSKNVEANGLIFKTTVTIWSLPYIVNSFTESEEFHHFYRIAIILLIVLVSNTWPKRGARSFKLVKTRMRSSMDLANFLLMQR